MSRPRRRFIPILSMKTGYWGCSKAKRSDATSCFEPATLEDLCAGGKKTKRSLEIIYDDV